MSLRFALLMMEAIVLWHKEGMSSSFGMSMRWRAFMARAGVGVFSRYGHGLGCVCVCGGGVWGVWGVWGYVVVDWPTCAAL